MAVFTVHIPQDGLSAPEKVIFLREGFSIWAFIFGPIWLLYKRAWLAAALWTAALALVAFAGAKLGASELAMSIVGTAMGAALGFEGNRLVAWTLTRRGYDERAVVLGDDMEHAETSFFTQWRGVAPVGAVVLQTAPVAAGEEPRG
jgi:hypothetical protein